MAIVFLKLIEWKIRCAQRSLCEAVKRTCRAKIITGSRGQRSKSMEQVCWSAKCWRQSGWRCQLAKHRIVVKGLCAGTAGINFLLREVVRGGVIIEADFSVMKACWQCWGEKRLETQKPIKSCTLSRDAAESLPALGAGLRPKEQKWNTPRQSWAVGSDCWLGEKWARRVNVPVSGLDGSVEKLMSPLHTNPHVHSLVHPSTKPSVTPTCSNYLEYAVRYTALEVRRAVSAGHSWAHRPRWRAMRINGKSQGQFVKPEGKAAGYGKF